jgi:hypothetical protein
MSLTKKIVLSSFFVFGIMGYLVAAIAPAQASPLETECQGYSEDDPYGVRCGQASGLTSADPRLIVGRIINIALSLLGIVSVVMIIFAGFKWMTAGGNEENAKSAQKIIFAGVVGLVIILSAYAISSFVLQELYKATQGAASYPN